jgi:photosystem II stability/assembly factor-like uncharacterized protein
MTTLPSPSPAINSITVVDQNIIWVACDNAGLYRTTNGGVSWVLRNTGIPSGNLYGISAIDSSNCWVGTVAGSIYRTTNGGLNWTLQVAVAGSFINGVKMFTSNYGVYTGDPTGSGQPYQMRFTTNGGTNWYNAQNSPIAANEYGVINAWDWIDTTHFWIGSANLDANATTAKIFRTSNGFSGTWSVSNVPGTGGADGLYYQAIAFVNTTNGMAGSNGNNIVRTTNGGTTWTAATIPAGVTNFAAINMHGMKDGSNIIRLSINETAGYRLFVTTDLGNTWTEELIPAIAGTNGIQHMQFVNANLGFAGGAAGMFLKYERDVPVELTSFTANASSGQVTLNWSTASELNNLGFEIQRKSINGQSNSDWTMVAFKEGHGTTSELNNYTYIDNVNELTADAVSYRLKQIDYNGNFEYSPVVLVDNLVPAEYMVAQNYPNPFNPSTVIEFQLPADNHVSLKVYNTLGQEVATLVNEVRASGTHKITFNADNLTSGVYYYILRVSESNGSEKVFTNKMMLLK